MSAVCYLFVPLQIRPIGIQFLAPFFQLAQPIRLLLNYVGEEFDDVHYEQGDG